MATQMAVCDVAAQLTRCSQSEHALLLDAELIADLLRRLVITALVLNVILGLLVTFPVHKTKKGGNEKESECQCV